MSQPEGNTDHHYYKYGVSKFPNKLWSLVNTCQTGALFWGQNGRTIIINEPKFRSKYLDVDPSVRMFKTSNFGSFVRCLNLYGFRKVGSHRKPATPAKCAQSGDHLVHEFQSDYFVRERPELMSLMERNVKVKKKKETSKRKLWMVGEDSQEGSETPTGPGGSDDAPAPGPAPALEPISTAPGHNLLYSPVPGRPPQITSSGQDQQQWYELVPKTTGQHGSPNPSFSPSNEPNNQISITGGNAWVRKPSLSNYWPSTPTHAHSSGSVSHHRGGDGLYSPPVLPPGPGGDASQKYIPRVSTEAGRAEGPAGLSGCKDCVFCPTGPGGDNNYSLMHVQEDGTTRIGEREFDNLVTAISDIIRQNPEAWATLLRSPGLPSRPTRSIPYQASGPRHIQTPISSPLPAQYQVYECQPEPRLLHTRIPATETMAYASPVSARQYLQPEMRIQQGYGGIQYPECKVAAVSEDPFEGGSAPNKNSCPEMVEGDRMWNGESFDDQQKETDEDDSPIIVV